MNLADALLIAAIALSLLWAVRRCGKGLRAGGCCGSCGGCRQGGCARREEAEKRTDEEK